MPVDWGTLGIIGSVTAASVSVVLYLEGRFRSIERLIYGEMNKHREEDDEKFDEHGTRIQRLELKTFGFTRAGR